jgi:GcrA cell cycle regulator
MSWTDERINLLKKMWKEGKSAAEIAKTLGKGVTRNAVIGKAHRMGLSGRPSPIKKPAPVKKEASSAPKKAPAASAPLRKPAAPASTKQNPILAKEAEDLKKLAKDEIPPGGGVSLLELTERMCKWPIGDPKEADFTFCGLGIRVGTPYCPAHAAMAFQTSSRRTAAVLTTVAANEDKVEEVADAEPAADEEVADDADEATA